MSLTAKVKKAEKLFAKARKQAKESGSGFTEIPDGKYLAALRVFENGESQGSGRLQNCMGFKIMEGEYENQMTRKYSGLEDIDSIAYFAQDLNRLGHEMPDSMDELDELGKAILAEKLVVRISLKTKANSEYQNLYINKVLTNRDYDDDDADGGEDDASIPATSEAFEKGARVSTEIDGEVYKGKVAGTNEDGDEVYIEFDDGDKQYIELAEVSLLAEEDPTPDPDPDAGAEGMDVGDRVIATIDGSDYAGEITEMSGSEATVKFDDGDTDSFEMEDLKAEEEEEEDPPGDPEPVGGASNTENVDLEKGMNVEVKVGKKTIDGEVTRISTSAGTINIKDEEGVIHKGIPLDKILTVYDD